jgi:hypothetical protein
VDLLLCCVEGQVTDVEGCGILQRIFFWLRLLVLAVAVVSVELSLLILLCDGV